ncbi:uncharacterized protein [Physcomitrium patens]|uniref:Transcription factor 25 n=1 Tax=Physcomitrium patens TaxID=3218 RepID=A0A2K1JT72_PHYPA|nr:hypothetical protein PHYPA_014497 [Physcomitrium patens]
MLVHRTHPSLLLHSRQVCAVLRGRPSSSSNFSIGLLNRQLLLSPLSSSTGDLFHNSRQMSGRMLKRMLQEQQPLPPPVPEGDGTDSEDDLHQSHVAKQPVRNMFDLLGSQDNEVELANEDEDEDNRDSSNNGVIEKKVTPTANVTKSKKKKNKGKNKGKTSTSVALETNSAAEESVDELLEQLALERHGETTSASDTMSARPVLIESDILAVDPRHLRAEDELRHIFGSKVINSVERSGEGSGLLIGRRRQPSRRGGRNLHKKSLLVTPLEHWPRLEGGLSMECTDQKEGLSFFRYVFSSAYQKVQNRYEDCVASHDPHTIAMLVNQNPYHVDSLLALAEVYKDLGEVQQSAELLERCIYALECAWHPGFNITTGKCRLVYSWEQNKPLFYALFKHMQHLGRRGCHRTALEVCKLILSLDSDDPLGALFCIDYFALRAEQYEWLQNFAREYRSGSPLPVLPNFFFSLALAQFHIEATRSSSRSSSDRKQPSQPSSKDEKSSLDLLQQALMLHPTVLRKIVNKAPIKEDAAWTKILSHKHFSDASPGGPTLEHLINIYTERNYLVWRAPDVQAWLKKAAQGVVEAADRAESSKDGGELAFWATVRQETFPPEQNEYKHLLVSEFSESGTTSTLPPEEMAQLGFEDELSDDVEFIIAPPGYGS